MHALAQTALELDREAVRLVADALQQQQRGAARRQHHGVLARGQVQLLRLQTAMTLHALRIARAVALLRDADGIERDSGVLQRCDGYGELPLAAIDHQQIGQRIAVAPFEAA